MAQYSHPEPYLSIEELAGPYRDTKDPVARNRWAITGTPSGSRPIGSRPR